MCADDVCKEGKVDANNMGERMDELYVSDFRGALWPLAPNKCGVCGVAPWTVTGPQDK